MCATVPVRVRIRPKRLQRSLGRYHATQADAERNERKGFECRGAAAENDLPPRAGAGVVAADDPHPCERNAEERAAARIRDAGEKASGGELLRARIPGDPGCGSSCVWSDL